MSDQEEIEVPEIPKDLINLTTAMEAVIGMGSIRLLGLTAAAWIAGYKAGFRDAAPVPLDESKEDW